jgi:uncharacterized protein with HEPN domain
MKNKPDLTFIGDVLDAIKRIEGYLRGVDKDAFEENRMMQEIINSRFLGISYEQQKR